MPMKPSTTLGIAAKSSMPDLRTSLTRPGATSAMKTAAAIPSGMAITAAPRVTRSEPRISGRMPKSGGSEIGYQLVPVRNAAGRTVKKSRAPSFRRKTKISETMRIEATPLARTSASTIFSLSRLFDNGHEVYLLDNGLAPGRQDVIHEQLGIALGLAICVDEKRPRDRVGARNHVVNGRGYGLGALRGRHFERLLPRADITHAVITDRAFILRDLIRDGLARGQKQRVGRELLPRGGSAFSQDMFLEIQMRARVDLARQDHDPAGVSPDLFPIPGPAREDAGQLVGRKPGDRVVRMDDHGQAVEGHLEFFGIDALRLGERPFFGFDLARAHGDVAGAVDERGQARAGPAARDGDE